MYTNSGCSRLVDYYFVVSCDDRGIGHIKEKLKHESLAPQNEKTARHAQFALKPKIIDRYPDINHEDTPLMPWVARTSMPRGIRARTRPPPPTFFTFVGWNTDTSKLYGACLMVFEKIHIKNQLQTVYIPKTLGFVSHYPYFCAFDVFLRCLWHVIPKKLIPLENLLIHYFYDIPAPAPSRKIAYDLGQMQVLLACRNEFDVPILELPMETAFTQLSKDRICFILKLLLLEQRVIFICGDMHQLTPVCELFVSLLFPLRWRHLYMPLLSHTMFQALMNKKPSFNNHKNHSKRFNNGSDRYEYKENAPFIVGLPRFVYLNPEIQNNMPINSFLVFLDRNEITDFKKKPIHPNDMKSGKIVPNLPNPLENTLRDAIHTLARILTMQVDGIQTQASQGQSTPQALSRSKSQSHSHQTHQSQHIKGSANGLNMGGVQIKRNGAANTSETSLYSQTSNSSQTSNASQPPVTAHNSMFISREYTLQAFRTMFAVMTKLLYLSAHKEYGNTQSQSDSDRDRDRDESNGNDNKKSKVDKYAKTQFIIKFRDTQVFQSFYKYYKRINGENDPYFKRMYLFYKENEGHGKHFARRQQNIWENEPFDRKLYDREIFQISKDKIKELESNNGKSQMNKLKKLNEIAKKRTSKYRYPTPEFEMLSEVKEFLKMYIWKEAKNYKRHAHGTPNDSYYSNSHSPRSRVSSRASGKPQRRQRRKHRKKNSEMDNQTVNVKGMNANKRERKMSKTKSVRSVKSNKSHKSHKSHRSHKSKRSKHNRKGSRKHVISHSNTSDITDVVLQTKIDKFRIELTQQKDLDKSLVLCLEMERKIQMQIAKNERNSHKKRHRSDMMAGSIDGAVAEIGFKLNEKNKDWKRIVYDIFKENIQGKHNLVSTMHELCHVYPQRKDELKILRGVVDLFDEELSLASMSVKSLFLNNNHKSTTSNTSTSVSTSNTSNSTSTTDEECSWGTNDSEETDSETDSDGTDSDGSDTASTESDKLSTEVTSDGWSTSSSSDWNMGSIIDEEQKDSALHGHGKFTKLDEFTLDKEEIEWFDKCERLHNGSVSSEGIKFINSLCDKKNGLIGGDFIDEWIVEKWKKSYKQRIKTKQKLQNKPSLKPKPTLKTEDNSTESPGFNINHSYNVYQSDVKNGIFTVPKKYSKNNIKYKKKKSVNSTANNRDKRMKSPPKLSTHIYAKSQSKKRKKSKSPKPKSPSSPLALNISPKSAHSSKYYQNHDIINVNYANNNGKHSSHYKSKKHSNNNGYHKKKKQSNEEYVD